MIKQQSSAEAVINILENFKLLLRIFQKAKSEDKNNLFPHIFNCTKSIYKYCMCLKRSLFSEFIVEYLICCVDTLRGSFILNRPKYINWIIKLNIEICKLFENQN